MSDEKSNHASINVHVGGDVSGVLGVGENITQTQQVGRAAQVVSAAELGMLREAFAELEAQVTAQAPAGSRDAALERVAELEAAVTEATPDLSTMEYVKKWFVKNVPAVAGTVAALVINPIVGKLVGAAGEVAAAEFKRRFSPDD